MLMFRPNNEPILQHIVENLLFGSPRLVESLRLILRGALFKCQNVKGIRVIIRDCHGKPVAALS